MDALITAAGLGTRARLPINMRKEMLPIYSLRNGEIVLRPMLDSIIYNLSTCGIKKFVVVLNKDDHSTENYLKSLDYKIEFVYQQSPAGYGNAVRMGADYFHSDFILNAGDGLILDIDITRKAIETHDNTGDGILALMKVKHPENYGVATLSGKRIINIVEKPEVPESHYALAAFYILNPELFKYIDTAELTPAISMLINDGYKMVPFKIRPYNWVSIGRSDEYYKILKRTYMHYKNLSENIK
ncbi:MAG: nucleotidyltransferase family protein [Ferroplasma sp.]